MTVITKIEELAGDKFYTVVTGEQVEIVSEETLVELVRHGVELTVAVEDGEIAEELSFIELDYMEVSQEESFGEDYVDVYRHIIEIEEGELNVKSYFEKEYKRYASAIKYANSQNTVMVIEG